MPWLDCRVATGSRCPGTHACTAVVLCNCISACSQRGPVTCMDSWLRVKYCSTCTPKALPQACEAREASIPRRAHTHAPTGAARLQSLASCMRLWPRWSNPQTLSPLTWPAFTTTVPAPAPAGRLPPAARRTAARTTLAVAARGGTARVMTCAPCARSTALLTRVWGLGLQLAAAAARDRVVSHGDCARPARAALLCGAMFCTEGMLGARCMLPPAPPTRTKIALPGCCGPATHRQQLDQAECSA